MSLTESVSALEEYLTKKNSEASKAVGSFSVTAKTGPVGSLTNSIKKSALSDIMGDLAENPLVQMGIDTLTQIVTTAVQQLVTDALKKINLSAIENATQNFMQIWATVSSFQSEVAMELARNCGKQLINDLNTKKQLITAIRADITALHNACNLIVNSGNFMGQYVKDLIAAYDILNSANSNFTLVSKRLKSSDPSFLNSRYNKGLAQLQQAQTLILPDRNADVSSIRGLKDLVETTVNRQSNKQAVAALLAIPGITLTIGQNMIKYVSITVDINLRLTTFTSALSTWSTSFTKNKNIYKVASDHLDAGMSQLAQLLDEMQTILLVAPGSAPVYDPASALFGVNVSASATMWGIQLQAIIQWMKLNPGVGAAQLDQTANSVKLYKQALKLIASYGDMSYSGGTLAISNGQEDYISSLKPLTTLLVRVNTLVATKNSKSSVISMFRPVDAMFKTSQQNIDRIAAALNPFLATEATLPGPAAKLLGDAYGVAQKYGLDRVAGLLTNGDIAGLFSVNPQNATFAGAALGGLNNIASAIRLNPDASDAQIAKIDKLRDVVQADKTAKEIEANRAYAANADAAQAKAKATIKSDKATIKPAIEAAKQIDAVAGTSPVDEATTKMSGVIPGFNTNNIKFGG